MKKIYISKSGISGKGMFVGEDVKKGERIQYVDGKMKRKTFKSKEESSHADDWIGIGHNVWIDPTGKPFQFINHSCAPNAAIVGKKTLIALADIPKDTEIAMDYSMTEIHDPFWKLKCACGAANCRRVIYPLFKTPAEVFARHFPHIPPYFQRAFLRHYISGSTADTGKA